ncbi:Velvet domain-containing protein [Rhizoctonia solani AG-1 IA]|uniref:Velvet domain-containing protein n=1 Tax=Thanatephorus cucumeris (strain AG1-IA) TaxID=983506 RepID=L8X013_THACA|nr:Velvet domain-containing protein [Rhizoctonia solani AG-1 IA]
MYTNSVTYPGIQEMYIGKPIRNVSGPFAGRTIRSQLQEYQKPDLGRKFARRDRRPVDPPPVVRLRMFEVLEEGTDNQHEEEISAELVHETTGLVAHVDLFAVSPPPGMTFEPLDDSMQTPSDDCEKGSCDQGSSSQEDRSDETSLVVDENSVLTSAVFGSSFVNAVKIHDLNGETVILFVFAQHNIVALCIAIGALICPELRRFPGLQASTELTKHLGRWGVRVNLREHSRGKRNKQGEEDGEEDEISNGGGEMIVDEEHGLQFYSRHFLAQQRQIVFGPPASHQGGGGYEHGP